MRHDCHGNSSLTPCPFSRGKITCGMHVCLPGNLVYDMTLNYTETQTLFMKNTHHPKLIETLILNFLLLVAIMSFTVGIYAPFMTTKKYFIFTNKISLLDALGSLWAQGYWVLFSVIVLFSLLFPISKMLLLIVVINRTPAEQSVMKQVLFWIEQHGKWSMLDVFVVAITIVIVKINAMASVTVNYGLYAFGLSILLTMLLTRHAVKRATAPAA